MVSEKLGNKLILPTKLSQFSCVYFLVLFYCQLRTQFVTFFDNSKIHRFIDKQKTICYYLQKYYVSPQSSSWHIFCEKLKKVEVFLNLFEVSFLLFKEYLFTRFEVVLFRHFNWDSLTKFNTGFFILAAEKIYEFI